MSLHARAAQTLAAHFPDFTPSHTTPSPQDGVTLENAQGLLLTIAPPPAGEGMRATVHPGPAMTPEHSERLDLHDPAAVDYPLTRITEDPERVAHVITEKVIRPAQEAVATPLQEGEKPVRPEDVMSAEEFWTAVGPFIVREPRCTEMSNEDRTYADYLADIVTVCERLRDGDLVVRRADLRSER